MSEHFIHLIRVILFFQIKPWNSTALNGLNPPSLRTGTPAEDQSSHWPWERSSFSGIISFSKKKTICESTLTTLSPHQGWWLPWHQSEFWAEEFGLSFLLLRQDRLIKRNNISIISHSVFLNCSNYVPHTFAFSRNTERMCSSTSDFPNQFPAQEREPSLANGSHTTATAHVESLLRARPSTAIFRILFLIFPIPLK